MTERNTKTKKKCAISFERTISFVKYGCHGKKFPLCARINTLRPIIDAFQTKCLHEVRNPRQQTIEIFL